MTFDRKIFFAVVRKAFDGLTRNQVKALEFLLASFENDPKWKDVRHIAYALATVKHETVDTCRPISEYGGVKYFDKYDTGKLAKRLGNTPEADGDGYLYRGRGYVQITGRDNYAKFGIEHKPEAALDPAEAFKILSVGMQVGSFTGKKLSDFIKGSTCDYKGARKVINGTDDNILIAGYARNFEEALRTAKTSAAVTHTQPTEQKPDDAVSAEEQGGSESAMQQPPGHQPVETTVTRVEDGVTVEATKPNLQDVNAPVEIDGGKAYQGIGFWNVIWRDIKIATGGNISLASLNEIAQQTTGWPPWLVGAIGKIALGVLIATCVYFVVRVIHYIVDRWQNNERVKTEAAAKTAIDRKDIVWK